MNNNPEKRSRNSISCSPGQVTTGKQTKVEEFTTESLRQIGGFVLSSSFAPVFIKKISAKVPNFTSYFGAYYCGRRGKRRGENFIVSTCEIKVV